MEHRGEAVVRGVGVLPASPRSRSGRHAASDEIGTESHLREFVRVHELWEETKRHAKEERIAFQRVEEQLRAELRRERKERAAGESRWAEELAAARAYAVRGREGELGERAAEVERLRAANASLEKELAGERASAAKLLIDYRNQASSLRGMDEEVKRLGTELAAAQRARKDANMDAANMGRRLEAMREEAEEDRERREQLEHELFLFQHAEQLPVGAARRKAPVSPLPLRSRSAGGCTRSSAAHKSLADLDAAVQEADWMDDDVRALVEHFRASVEPFGHRESLTQFLGKLSAVWSRRLDERVTEVQERSRKRLEALKRQHDQRVPYAEVVQQVEIQRLRKTLRETRGEFMRTRGDHNPSLVEVALAAAESLSRQVTLAEREIARLRVELYKASSSSAPARGRASSSGGFR